MHGPFCSDRRITAPSCQYLHPHRPPPYAARSGRKKARSCVAQRRRPYWQGTDRRTPPREFCRLSRSCVSFLASCEWKSAFLSEASTERAHDQAYLFVCTLSALKIDPAGQDSLVAVAVECNLGVGDGTCMRNRSRGHIFWP